MQTFATDTQRSSWGCAGHNCGHAGGCEHRHQLGVAEDFPLWGRPGAGVPGGSVLWSPAVLPHHPSPGAAHVYLLPLPF